MHNSFSFRFSLTKVFLQFRIKCWSSTIHSLTNIWNNVIWWIIIWNMTALQKMDNYYFLFDIKSLYFLSVYCTQSQVKQLTERFKNLNFVMLSRVLVLVLVFCWRKEKKNDGTIHFTHFFRFCHFQWILDFF